MSSYINFYLIEKSDGRKRRLLSFQSCNQIYETFVDGGDKSKDEEGFHPISISDIERMESSVREEITKLKKWNEKECRAKEKVRQSLVEALGKALSEAQTTDAIRRLLSQAQESLLETMYDAEPNEEAEEESLTADLEMCLGHLNLLVVLLYDIEYSSEWSGICYAFDWENCGLFDDDE